MLASDAFFWNIKRLHVIFACSSVALLGVMFWWLAADHAEEWHDHQRTFEEILVLRANKRIREIRTPAYLQEESRLQEIVQAEEETLAGQKSAHDAAKVELAKTALALEKLATALKSQTASVNGVRSRQGLARHAHRPQKVLDALQVKFDAESVKAANLSLEVEQAKKANAEVADKVKLFTKPLEDAQGQLKAWQEKLALQHKTLAKLKGDGWFARFKRNTMEWPILQGFNSHLAIQQDWLPDLPIQLGVAKTARIDRCRTCHLGIDHVEAGNVPSFPHGHASQNNVATWDKENKFPHPYATHPNPDLFLTASSPHPVSKFGCTICHDGNGSGTKFNFSEHGPGDPQQAADWKKKYGYHSNHYWEYPMKPKQFIESGCIQCHHSMEELGAHPKYGESAPKVFHGYRIIQKYGCYGCHEIHGNEGTKSIGPDLRLEPAYSEAAQQLLYDDVIRKSAGKTVSGSTVSTAEISRLAKEIIRHPEESSVARAALMALIKKDTLAKRKAEAAVLAKTVNVDDRVRGFRALESQYLSATSHGLVDLFKSPAHPGKYRKVGPSFRYIKEKTTQNFIRYWTEKPKRFRPSTRMPQFFDLTNQQDPHAAKLTPIEIAAVAHYLHEKSQPFEFLAPPKGFTPNVERGKKAFEERGCLACHQHKDSEGADNDFGPDLSRISEKLIRDPKDPNFSRWLYTWIREPQRYHTRSKMPDMKLKPVTKTVMLNGQAQQVVEDPAADITAYLLSTGKATFAVEKAANVSDAHLNELVELYLKKVLTTEQRGNRDATKGDSFFGSRQYPIRDLRKIKGDEIELALGTRDGRPDDAEWKNVRLNYIGRRTISRYGCYGCHDIPGFESARTIGASLQDWGRKDTSKLALEHITEYLSHHGEVGGGSTDARAESAYKQAEADSFPDAATKERETSMMYFYQNLQHHGRPGFLWQKLRAPRSYDYKKIKGKGYDERLRMPKFSFNEKQIEDVATFVLGLIAEPPPEKYQYRPKGASYDIIEGERLLKKYNCISCHMTELPKVTAWVPHGSGPFYVGDTKRSKERKPALGLTLLDLMRPARKVDTSKTRMGYLFDEGDKTPVKQSLMSFYGLPVFTPEEAIDVLSLEDEDPAKHTFHLWEHLDVEGRKVAPGPTMISVWQQDLVSKTSGRGGRFAEWLYRHLKSDSNRVDPQKANLARHKIPPVLWKEGQKVQTPWLYQFLRNPIKLRPMAVLRMPRFNMSEKEAQILANYFAAVDGVSYPYQRVPQRTSEYVEQKNHSLGFPKTGQKHSDYLSQSWKLLNNKNLCLACHSVAGTSAIQAGAPGAVLGPNLEHAADRLRPQWTQLWLADPRWITPYTQMPVNFELHQKKFLESFGGDGKTQWEAVRDALMNYHRLMEQHRKSQFDYPKVGAVDLRRSNRLLDLSRQETAMRWRRPPFLRYDNGRN